MFWDIIDEAIDIFFYIWSADFIKIRIVIVVVVALSVYLSLFHAQLCQYRHNWSDFLWIDSIFLYYLWNCKQACSAMAFFLLVFFPFYSNRIVHSQCGERKKHTKFSRIVISNTCRIDWWNCIRQDFIMIGFFRTRK